MPQEIITRRNLPHWYIPAAIFFVTYRLHGTFPKHILEKLRAEKERLLNNRKTTVPVAVHRQTVHKKLFAEYDRYLDQSTEIDWLRDPRVAAKIRENLYHHHGQKYHLMSYCVMPSHVHVLLQPIDANVAQAARQCSQASRLSYDDENRPLGEREDKLSPLARIMHSLKSYTAHEANKLLQRTGTFWQSESYDHWVRDEDELERIVGYIAANPVSARLVDRPENWYFSSCHDRFLTDGEPIGWLHWP